MSFRAVEAALERSKAKPLARFVLVVIAECANHEGEQAWPSIETIARRTGMHRATVHRALDELEEIGELERTSKGGRHGCNSYTIKIDGLSQSARIAERDRRTERQSQPATEQSRRATGKVAQGDTNHPNHQNQPLPRARAQEAAAIQATFARFAPDGLVLPLDAVELALERWPKAEHSQIAEDCARWLRSDAKRGPSPGRAFLAFLERQPSRSMSANGALGVPTPNAVAYGGPKTCPDCGIEHDLATQGNRCLGCLGEWENRMLARSQA
jgi:hypothetical protein